MEHYHTPASCVLCRKALGGSNLDAEVGKGNEGISQAAQPFPCYYGPGRGLLKIATSTSEVTSLPYTEQSRVGVQPSH